MLCLSVFKLYSRWVPLWDVHLSETPRWGVLCHRIRVLIGLIRIIIYRTDTFVYFNTLKQQIFCYYFAVFFFPPLCLLAQRTFHQRDPNKIAVFLAAQKLLPMIDYIQTTHYHINQESMRQCIYTAIQDSCNAPNRTYLTCTVYFRASFIIMYSLLHRNQRKRKKGEYFTA